MLLLLLVSAESNDYETIDPFEFFFPSPVYEGQSSTLSDAITMTIDDRVEQHEDFYILVNSSLTTPEGVIYDESFFVSIVDDGK